MPAGEPGSTTRAPGTVWIVGAGPGDPELLTLRAWRVLREADVVYHDRLIDPRLLAALPSRVRRVDVGKAPGARRTREAEIIERLVRSALRGESVVRLKGGDPCVFGRGGEEARALARRGIPFQVVPGVSAATAAPELAGIPLTYRGVARSIAVATARTAVGSPLPHFPRADTLVVLMGVGVLEGATAALRRDGWSDETPCALVERASLPGERLVTGTLSTIDGLARREGIRPPATLVVGRTVLLRVPMDRLGTRGIRAGTSSPAPRSRDTMPEGTTAGARGGPP